jgi:hypothetical protein
MPLNFVEDTVGQAAPDRLLSWWAKIYLQQQAFRLMINVPFSLLPSIGRKETAIP